MNIEIKCRFSGSVLFLHEHIENTMKLTVDAAVKARANLARAYLAGANLDGANLAGANLARANLYGANLYGEALTKAPLSLLNLTWPVLITEGYMRIGCQRHAHSEWADFDSAAIGRMESRASYFWTQWRDVLLTMCKQHSATPT